MYQRWLPRTRMTQRRENNLEIQTACTKIGKKAGAGEAAAATLSVLSAGSVARGPPLAYVTVQLEAFAQPEISEPLARQPAMAKRAWGRPALPQHILHIPI